MSEDKVYKDGDIVWVKLGNNWWPGEVTGPTRHPEGLIKHLKRVPYCVVKFFNENTYEYVRSSKQIFPFQCAKQEEFIRKGCSLYNSGNSFMEKFPSDVEMAKQLTRRQESSIIINNRPDSIVKAILGQPIIRSSDEYYDGSEFCEKRDSSDSVTKILNITPNRNISKSNKNVLDDETTKTQTRTNALNKHNDKTKNVINSAAKNNSYQCNLCDFTSVRQNVLILHRKMHLNRNNGNSTISKPISSEVIIRASNCNINKNQIQENQSVKQDNNISKTKANTTTVARPAKTHTPLKEVSIEAKLVPKTTPAINVAENVLISLTHKEKNKASKSKTREKIKESQNKEENVYDKILSDFCPSETETSPSSEEKQSRRSLRHCQNLNENTEGKSTVCIDLAETKAIQKIPKKREYPSMHEKLPLEKVVAEPDVVCLGDNEKESGSTTTSKADAEDIRRMLLADWSDDDETPSDAIVVDDSIVVESTESVEGIYGSVNEQSTSAAVVVTTVPVVQTAAIPTGRIRNIPKKDRRDVVLQDFNSDLTHGQSENTDDTTKTLTVDLDSSNSSIVEIVEDKEPAMIITINDDEEQAKNQTDLNVHESKDSDSAVDYANDKFASTATSTTTLSCFDFQEDEDEQDNNTAPISHFKKKYLSSDKLQTLTLATADESREDNVAKSRAEMVEKDQRLAAEIETLLEEIHPPVPDLLNANTFEENISVKDLPIKERGKRIFKSRNRTRMEGKGNAEMAPVMTVELSLPMGTATIEEYNSNVHTSTSGREILDIDGKEPEPVSENDINKKCLIEISSQELLCGNYSEIPKTLEDKQLKPNENKENEEYLSQRNKNYSEVSNDDDNEPEYQNEPIEMSSHIDAKSKDNVMENDPTGQQQDYGENNGYSTDKLAIAETVTLNQQQALTEKSRKNEGSLFEIDQRAFPKEPDQGKLLTEDKEKGNICCQIVLDVKDNNRTNPTADLPVAAKEDKPVNNIKITEIEIIPEKALANHSATETVVAKSSVDSQGEDEELKTFLPIDQSEYQKPCPETLLKIQVKSPDELIDETNVTASQQEPESQTVVDGNIEACLTPTDENSSMGTSETGAEFGSPTSMLSEERLPAFRFQSNQTPQQEIETETVQEEQLVNADKINEHFTEDKSKIYNDFGKNVLQQRRFSMNVDSLQTEPKLIKRERFSVDDIISEGETVAPTIIQSKSDSKIRHKSRHMKFTPRRNVEDLSKVRISFNKLIRRDVEGSTSLQSANRTQVLESTVKKLEKQPLNNDKNIAANNDTTVSNETFFSMTDTTQKRNMTLENIVPNKGTENINLKSRSNEEELNEMSEKQHEKEPLDDVIPCIISAVKIPETESSDQFRAEDAMETQNEKSPCPTDTKDTENPQQQDDLCDINISNTETIVTTVMKSNIFDKSIENACTDESILTNIDRIENKNENLSAIVISTVGTIDVVENDKSSQDMPTSLDNSKTPKEQPLYAPYSPGVPPPTPQEREVVIESDNNIHNTLNSQQTEVQAIIGEESTIPLISKEEAQYLNESANKPRMHPDEVNDQARTFEESEMLIENMRVTPLEIDTINDSIPGPVKTDKTKPITEYEAVAKNSPLQTQQSSDVLIQFENNINIPKENDSDNECENNLQIDVTSQAKDLIIECEPPTPQGVIESDQNMPAQVTPEKEIIVESQVVFTEPIEENLRLDEKETLLEREFQVIDPKENSTTVGIQQETQANILQTDADKAAEEFLIEFDSIVNHSHIVDEAGRNSTLEDATNAEDLINNIIEEVHEDNQVIQDAPIPSKPNVGLESLTKYTVVAPKNSWNQIFKDSFGGKMPLAKRRQTICVEICNANETVASKKQALDFESILPVNKTLKRTAERKLTLPAIETKLSKSHQSHNTFALSHNQITLNKKFIPATKRKLSIEDNITSFVIQRPKQPLQQPLHSVKGPPTLQKTKPLSVEGQIISKDNLEALSEPSPVQSHDNLFHDFFQAESASPTSTIDLQQKVDGGRVKTQQIFSTPTISSAPQPKTTDAPKMSKNKQIGVDSRGNKYVIIKTPPTDIIVQPTLTASTASAVTSTNNLGTTITIQPMTRSATEVRAAKPTTKCKPISPAPTTTSSRKQQLQQQQMKQISITLSGQSAVEVSKSSEVAAKTHSRNRRKTKAITAITTANSNINSDKHRQAMEALSRRLSISLEGPPLAKISRTSTAAVQTQLSNNSNLTFFGDTHISNIAQQQLMQLHQQQQQLAQTISTPQKPVILNKNVHHQSIIKRKPRKISQVQQQQQQITKLNQHQIASSKSAQLFQQLQQQQQQHQNQVQQQQPDQQLQQQQFGAQIATPQPQQSQQQLSSLQPPPLHQIQSQTVPMQQQIVQQSDGIIITAPQEDDNVIDSMQLIALPTQPYPGYSETFLLCKVKGNMCKPVDNVPLYLNHQLNELVPVPLEAIESGQKTHGRQVQIKATNDAQQLLASQQNEPQGNEGNLHIANMNCNLMDGEISGVIESDHQMHHHTQQQQIVEDCVVDENDAGASQINEFVGNQEVNTDLVSNNGILLNIEGQQVLLDAATFAHLLANPDANTQLISDDGTEYVLTHEVLTALQMQQEQQQALELASAAASEEQQHQQQQGSDIIAVALAGSDLYDNDVLTIDTSQGMQLIDGDGSIVFPAQTCALSQQHLTPPAVVTNAVLDQSPIMSTLEVPSSIATNHKLQGTQIITVPPHHLAASSNAALGMGGRSNLEDSLAAIGVTTQTSSIPPSLGLPITVTNPNIASKVTSAGPLNEILQFVSHRPATAAATAAAVAAAALAGESRIFND